jgi:hypothetical protein
MPEVEELKVNCFVHPVYLHVKMRRNGLLWKWKTYDTVITLLIDGALDIVSA